MVIKFKLNNELEYRLRFLREACYKKYSFIDVPDLSDFAKRYLEAHIFYDYDNESLRLLKGE